MDTDSGIFNFGSRRNRVRMKPLAKVSMWLQGLNPVIAANEVELPRGEGFFRGAATALVCAYGT
jgi:hypothetical protein